MLDLQSLVRTIPDYPKPGIMFRDITTLLADGPGLQACIAQLCAPLAGQGIEAVVGIEARGFILGGALAERLGAGFVPLRKKGKLPGQVISQDYELEYGVDTIEIHADALPCGRKVVLIDDLIATGGTACAGVKLLRRLDVEIHGAAFVIDLPDLGGMARLRNETGVDGFALMAFEGE
ncbi:MAG: adenine phosphoribosyltransferase [Pseudomonadota bacterium]